jgi:hypothetical protein
MLLATAPLVSALLAAGALGIAGSLRVRREF